MGTDDLSAPLGQGAAHKRRRTIPYAVPAVLIGTATLCVVLLTGWAMTAVVPFGREAIAVAPPALTVAASGHQGDSARPVEAIEPLSRQDGSPAAEPPTASLGTTITIIDGTSGKRREIVLPGPSDRPESRSGSIDPRLAESSRHGPLPRIAPDGTRVADVYARPVKALTGKQDPPRIALVVGGLGTGAVVTNDALVKLPGPVTLAFAPYGSGLEQLSARARSSGHEILLQIPMEPLEPLDRDPGPQALLTSLPPDQNIDRLHWLMGRFQGYVGIASFMGGRFTSSEQALTPVLLEAGKRGLVYLDDGASPRSLARQIAGANNVAFAGADLTIDGVASPSDVDRALARLESLARERGAAIGIASAQPVSIDRISRWAKLAESRGILLVPITAVINKQKSG